MSRSKFGVVAFAVLISAGVASHGQGTQGNNHLGTWMVTITPPGGVRPPFSALITFTSGGAFIISTQNDHLANAGIQQGTWQREKHGQITSTQLSFLYSSTGIPLGTQKVRATYEFDDADNLTGHGELGTCDLNGANCTWNPGSASLQGTRVQVEEPAGP